MFWDDRDMLVATGAQHRKNHLERNQFAVDYESHPDGLSAVKRNDVKLSLLHFTRALPEMVSVELRMPGD